MVSVIVKTQAEFDALPGDFEGSVYIQSPADTRLYIARRLPRASVVAWGNASVEARENASVVAWGNTQVVKRSPKTNIKVHGNARIVTMPFTIEEYCDFYGVTIKEGQAILHKAVRPDLASIHNPEFQYAVRATFKHPCDPNTKVECSTGLHVAHLQWALDFGRERGRFKIIECAVPLDKIVLPNDTDGKVRTSELTVLREVPLEECGLYGKMLAKQFQG